ncbi:MAG: NAD(P)-dependent oxidoreductase [Candidatus Binatia bacterium]
MASLGKKVCIPGPIHRPWIEEGLRAAGCEVLLGQPVDEFPKYRYQEAELIDLVADSDILLVTTRERVTRSIMEACENLRGVVKGSIGVEKIDIKAATDMGILVCNSPAPENFIGLAEAVVGLMVILMKRLRLNEQVLQQGGWRKEKNVGELILGKTVGIIGLGRVGREVVKRLGAWGVRLVAYDPYVKQEQVKEMAVELVSLEEVLRESDIVSIHAVLTSETTHLIALKELRMMKPSAYLINTARGEVINQEELASALREGVIAGAALDVFEEEPLPRESSLRTIDPTRLILTPHIIGNNLPSRLSGQSMAMDSILCLLRGETPLTVLNREAIPRWQERFGRPLG